MSDKDLTLLYQSIGYVFKDPNLPVMALSHPSLNDLSRNSERLEFLGDAVLKLAISHILMETFPQYCEGKLAKFRAHLVSKVVLYEVALKLHVPSFLILSQGEEKIGGRENINNIENAMEALIGAIYSEAGFNEALIIIEKLWRTHYRSDPDLIRDSKSLLQEIVQAKDKELPKYTLVSKDGQCDKPHFKVKVEAKSIQTQYGQGSSLKRAEKEAAKLALIAIDKKYKQLFMI